MRLLPCGEEALLVEVEDLAAVLALAAALRAHPPPGMAELVPAERTVLLRCAPAADLAAVGEAVWTRAAAAGRREPVAAGGAGGPAAVAGDAVHIPVRYDGVDLAEVAEILGMSPAQVVARHTAAFWTVAFCGFAPGFGYLAADPPFPAVPRRSTPRSRVPPGAVALAGSYSGVYPRASPGGWQLIGRTDMPMFDLAERPPAVLYPGRTVRFSELRS